MPRDGAGRSALTGACVFRALPTVRSLPDVPRRQIDPRPAAAEAGPPGTEVSQGTVRPFAAIGAKVRAAPSLLPIAGQSLANVWGSASFGGHGESSTCNASAARKGCDSVSCPTFDSFRKSLIQRNARVSDTTRNCLAEAIYGTTVHPQRKESQIPRILTRVQGGRI